MGADGQNLHVVIPPSVAPLFAPRPPARAQNVATFGSAVEDEIEGGKMRCEIAEELRIGCRDVFLEDNLDTRCGETFQIQVIPLFRVGQVRLCAHMAADLHQTLGGFQFSDRQIRRPAVLGVDPQTTGEPVDGHSVNIS